MEDTKKRLESILTPKEISEVEMFLERQDMVAAVKKVLYQPILSEGTMKAGEAYNPGRNFMLGLVGSQHAEQGLINDEALGQDVRARWKAISLIEVAFMELEKLKKVEVKEVVKENKAR